MPSRNDSIQWPETKRKLVGAGVSLMRAKGFHGTSLDEICAAAEDRILQFNWLPSVKVNAIRF